MNLGNLRTLCRLTIPGAKTTRISNATLDIIINDVVKNVNQRLGLLNQDEKFNVAADQYKYDLSDSSETVTRFFKIDNLGLWWNAGSASSTDWRRLYPKTIKWLDKNFPQWRDASSGDPLYYAKKGRYLYTYPTPDTALTDGFWLYFIEQTIAMSKDSDYPFGNTSEIPEYSGLADVIVKGVEWWIKPMIGKKAQQPAVFKEYLALLDIQRTVLRTNLDISSDKKAKIHLKKVC